MKIRFPYLLLAGLIVAAGLFFFFSPSSDVKQLLAKVREDKFEIAVINTGELKAKNYTEIVGPMGLRQLNIYQIKIQNLIPEGTRVKEGDIVAQLDKSDVMTKITDESLNYQRMASSFKQAQLDTTLTMRNARDELVNLKYATEEKKLTMQQSKYEPAAIQRQAEIDYEKAVRTLEQKTENYKTQHAQCVTKMLIIGSDLSKAKGKLDQLLKIVEELTIKAPKDGMLIYEKDWDGKKKTIGQMVNTWEPVVAKLPDLREMQSVTYINEVDIQKVKPGQKVIITLDAQPGKQLEGNVISIANIGEQKPNSDAKVFEVVIDIATRDTTLRPSMTTSNKIITEVINKSTIVPLESIYTDKNINFVFKKTSAGYERQEVKPGKANETEITILKGLVKDDEVYLSLPADTSNKPLLRLK
jgi:multidrug efflux pump subunit AcrA (membrane-fusion protein)